MKHCFLFILFFSSFVLMNLSLKGQEHKICIDTNLVDAKPLKIGDITVHVFDFKNNLSNGKWYYYQIKNCNQKNIDEFLKVEGEFLDSARNGSFKYYYLRGIETKNKQQPYIIIKYKKGLLDGEFAMFSSNGTKLYEGFFANGKRDGFFIEYDPVKLNNTIRQIDFFINDTLQYSAKYNENGEFIRK